MCDDGGMIHSNGATFPFAAIALLAPWADTTTASQGATDQVLPSEMSASEFK